VRVREGSGEARRGARLLARDAAPVVARNFPGALAFFDGACHALALHAPSLKRRAALLREQGLVEPLSNLGGAFEA
jgi:hypothetical protein